MSRPVLLDLFCGAGLAADGYIAAGFDVLGVDITDQPDYPGAFVRADAVDVLEGALRGDVDKFDAIHASPPCQKFSTMSNRDRGHRSTVADDLHDDLLSPTLGMLAQIDVPWVVENVAGARRAMPANTIVLTGGMFGLHVHRPRLFAASFDLVAPPPAKAPRPAVGVYGKLDGRLVWRRKDGTEQRAARTVEEARWAMGVDRDVPWHGVKEGFPPAYTEWIGRQLAEQLP